MGFNRLSLDSERAVTPATDSYEKVFLDEWRRKAVNVFTTAGAIVYLPAVALMVIGQAPPNGRPAQAIAVGTYLTFVYCTLRPRTHYRTKTWAVLAAGYVVALLHLITVPQGPFGLALLAMLPILAIVILGAPAGWMATVVSMGLLLFGRLLQRVPGLVEMLTNEPPIEQIPLNVVFYQGLGLIAVLAGQMILLDRFHDFFMLSLADVEREARERTAAYCNLEHEMRKRRQLEYEVTRAGDNERRRLGQDVHDGVCQQITGALLRCQALERQLERGERLKIEDVGALSLLLEEAIDEAHAVAKGLWPLESTPDALAPALRALAKRTQKSGNIHCEFTATGDVRVSDPAMARHLYRIAQEALSNAVRHSKASRIVLELCGDGSELRLQVQDDGIGIPEKFSGDGMGMHTMAYRAQMINGEFIAERAAERGTWVICRVPRNVRQVPDDQSCEIERRKINGA